MVWKNWQVSALAILFTLTGPCGLRAGDVKPSDEGKAAEFKGKTFDMKEKGEVAILLSCVAGREVTVTTKGDKQTDVHLFIYAEDKKEVGNDTSPGPKCEVKFTPVKDGKFKLLVRNVGPGANKVTLEAKVDDVKANDEGKGADFKGKTFEIKDKGEVAILLFFAAGKQVTVTTNGEKDTDVHLFVYAEDKKEVGKDTSPGPKCEVKFTPAKDGKFKLLVKNSGGTNKVTVEVKVAK